MAPGSELIATLDRVNTTLADLAARIRVSEPDEAPHDVHAGARDSFKFTTVQLNRNYGTKMHVDGNNHGPTLVTRETRCAVGWALYPIA